MPSWFPVPGKALVIGGMDAQPIPHLRGLGPAVFQIGMCVGVVYLFYH